MASWGGGLIGFPDLARQGWGGAHLRGGEMMESPTQPTKEGSTVLSYVRSARAVTHAFLPCDVIK